MARLSVAGGGRMGMVSSEDATGLATKPCGPGGRWKRPNRAFSFLLSVPPIEHRHPAFATTANSAPSL